MGRRRADRVHQAEACDRCLTGDTTLVRVRFEKFTGEHITTWKRLAPMSQFELCAACMLDLVREFDEFRSNFLAQGDVLDEK